MTTHPTQQRSRLPPGFVPETQPVVPTPPLAGLKPDTLALDFIRHAFAQPSSWRVEPLFSQAFAASIQHLPDTTRAAVFMPLVQRSDGLHMLFTRRSAHLSHHPGQVSFPGGRIDPQDADAVAAAIRETHEEVGIAPQYAQALGTQPDLLTGTRFVVTPVVGTLREGFQIRPNHDEVAEVFEVPLSVLMDSANYRLHRVTSDAQNFRLYFSITWRSHFIWGATAALLRNFHRFLLAAQQQHQ